MSEHIQEPFTDAKRVAACLEEQGYDEWASRMIALDIVRRWSKEGRQVEAHWEDLSLSQMHEQIRELQAKVKSLSGANELAASVCRKLDEDMKRVLSALELRSK